MTAISTKQASFQEFWNWNPSAPNGERGLSYTPVANFLTSPENRLGWRGDQFLKTNFDGQIKNVTAQLYFPPMNTAAAPEDIEFCDDSTSVEFVTKTVAPVMGVAAHKVAFDGDCDYKTMLEGGDSYRASVIANAFVDIAKQTEKQIVENMLLLAGKFSTEITDTVGGLGLVKNVQTVRNCDTGCELVGNTLLRKIFQDVERNEYRFDAPIIIGDGLMWDYMLGLNSQAVDNTGFDAAKYLDLYNYAFIRSRYASGWATVPVANPFLTVDRGAVQLIEYSCFEGKNLDKGSISQYTLRSPIDGMLVDVLEKTTCDNGIKTQIVMKRNFGLVGLPDNLYPVGNSLNGVTNVNLYNVVNPA